MRRARSALLLVLAALSGCGGGPARVPQLGLGPFRPGDASIFEQAELAAVATGHAPTEADAVHGRFVLRSTTDPEGEIRFVVQCHADGWITVSPEGRRVVVVGTSFRIPREIRTEYAQLVMGLERGVSAATR